MKPITNRYLLICAVFTALCGSLLFAGEANDYNDNTYFPACPAITLNLEVSSFDSAGPEDSLKFSEWMARNRQMEQTLTAILRVEGRSYGGGILSSAVPNYRRWFRTGTRFLLEQARDEVHCRSNPLHRRDTFRDFFGYTDFLYRSNRSIMISGGRNIRSLEYKVPIH